MNHRGIVGAFSLSHLLGYIIILIYFGIWDASKLYDSYLSKDELVNCIELHIFQVWSSNEIHLKKPQNFKKRNYEPNKSSNLL